MILEIEVPHVKPITMPSSLIHPDNYMNEKTFPLNNWDILIGAHLEEIEELLKKNKNMNQEKDMNNSNLYVPEASKQMTDTERSPDVPLSNIFKK